MLNIQTGLERLKSFGFSPQSVLDIGAYEGSFARQARSVWPDAYILMVEAIEEKQEILKNTSIEIGNSGYKMCLIGDQNIKDREFFVVKAEFQGIPVNTGSSLYRENSPYPVEKRMLSQFTLETAVEPYNKSFDFIKLDVQGAELDIISGAQNIINAAEVILMELSILQYNRGSPLFAEVIAKLRSIGFVMFDIIELSRVAGHLNQLDGIFVKSDSWLRLKFPNPSAE